MQGEKGKSKIQICLLISTRFHNSPNMVDISNPIVVNRLRCATNIKPTQCRRRPFVRTVFPLTSFQFLPVASENKS